jgi:hypothetical protein
MNHPSMFVAWEIWKECNARVFRRHDSTAAMVIGKVKNEARAWRFGWSKIFEQCNFATAASLQVLGLVLDNYSKTFVSILIKMTKNASVFLKWQPYSRLCCSCVQCKGSVAAFSSHTEEWHRHIGSVPLAPWFVFFDLGECLGNGYHKRPVHASESLKSEATWNPFFSLRICFVQQTWSICTSV